MGRFWIDRPFGYDEPIKAFCCKTCRNKGRIVQLGHVDNVMYWEVKGPFTGVMFDEVIHTLKNDRIRDGVFYRGGTDITFDPYMTGLHTTGYQDVFCTVCKIQVGYYIMTLDATFIFHSVLI